MLAPPCITLSRTMSVKPWEDTGRNKKNHCHPKPLPLGSVIPAIMQHKTPHNVPPVS